ncbi:MAG: hypothetical protein O2887_07850 [Bacteroidetes bacterium]|nr:hypothetical protein [Bacteroidota bacterium]MDA1120393.1 hypothetical protein [Bacteroidota bacterium]
MHEIQPFHRWLQYYDPVSDEVTPFHGKEYNYDVYSETIYGYYIDPAWDFMGSETLYLKILFTDYDLRYSIIEFIGEWNDAINNDVMHLKRNVLEPLIENSIDKFILIGESVLNFHGSDDCYYEEWFEEIQDGWIAAVNFREHVLNEWTNYNIDSYVNFGGSLEINNWRTMKPHQFFQKVDSLIQRRISI